MKGRANSELCSIAVSFSFANESPLLSQHLAVSFYHVSCVSSHSTIGHAFYHLWVPVEDSPDREEPVICRVVPDIEPFEVNDQYVTPSPSLRTACAYTCTPSGPCPTLHLPYTGPTSPCTLHASTHGSYWVVCDAHLGRAIVCTCNPMISSSYAIAWSPRSSNRVS